MIKQPFDLVLVEWLDSSGGSGWEPIDIEAKPIPMACQSVGWLVSESEIGILLMSHISDPNGAVHHQGCGSMTIPKITITGIHKLNIGGKRKKQ